MSRLANVINDWESVAVSLTLIGTSAMVQLWALLYPFLTGFTCLAAAIVAGHSLMRLAYRWWKGHNTITSNTDYAREPFTERHDDP